MTILSMLDTSCGWLCLSGCKDAHVLCHVQAFQGEPPGFFAEFAVRVQTKPSKYVVGLARDQGQVDRRHAWRRDSGRIKQHANAPQHNDPSTPGKEALVATVREISQAILGVKVGSSQPLMESGLDSLASVELRNALASRFGLDLSPTIVFDYPTADALAAFLATQLQSAGEQHSILKCKSNSHNARPQDRLRSAVQEQPKHRDPKAGSGSSILPSEARNSSLSQQIVTMVESVLGHSINPTQPLMEAGLDSLSAVELRNALSRLTGMDLPPTIIFDYPSTAELTKYMEVEARACSTEFLADTSSQNTELEDLQVTDLWLELLCC
jgi:acyl carrier protein